MSVIAGMLLQGSRMNKSQQLSVATQADARSCLSMILGKLRTAGWDPMSAGLQVVQLDTDLGDGISEIEVFADLDADGDTDGTDEQVLIRHIADRIEWRRSARRLVRDPGRGHQQRQRRRRHSRADVRSRLHERPDPCGGAGHGRVRRAGPRERIAYPFHGGQRSRLQEEAVSERGSALILAVFLLAILAGLGMALHFQALTELTMSAADRQAQQTYFLAEAGIEAESAGVVQHQRGRLVRRRPGRGGGRQRDPGPGSGRSRGRLRHRRYGFRLHGLR